MKNLLWIFISLSILFVSCKSEGIEPIDPSVRNNVSIEFDNRIGTKSLILNNATYQNAAGEDFTVSTLNYFISNVSFKNTTGAIVSLSDQYFLLKQSNLESLLPILKDVPSGDYTEISFTIGVDSVKSISAVEQRTGVLDPASYGNDNMYWSWNSGYIFLKLEGSSPAAVNVAAPNKFQYHIGGFGGRTSATANNLKKVTLPLPQTIHVRKTISPTIHIIADIAKVFSGPNVIKIANASVIMSPALALPISANYGSMFTVDHIHE